MSRAAWSCDFCETNNGAANDVCRNCGGERAVAGGSVPKQVYVGRPQTTAQQPVFVNSKHATTPEDVLPAASTRLRFAGSRPVPAESLPPEPELIAPVVEPPRLASSPPRTPEPPVPRRPPSHGRVARRIAWFGMVAIAGALVVGNWDSLVDLLPDIDSRSSSEPGTPAGTPCPPEVAQWLPDGGSGAVLEAAYTTPKFTITVCQTTGDQLYYDGQVTGVPANTETHISLPATRTPTGYVAQNGTYVYEIVGDEVIVTHDDVNLTRQTLTRTGP